MFEQAVEFALGNPGLVLVGLFVIVVMAVVALSAGTVFLSVMGKEYPSLWQALFTGVLTIGGAHLLIFLLRFAWYAWP